jgi:serine/threonine protein kinase
VYRASIPSEQYLHRAIKFCLDRSMMPVLQRERANLERLIEAGGRSWSPRLVRLYGYDFDHETPHLVYEFVPGGDLVGWLARRRARTGKGLTPAEVLALIVQVIEGLAFVHERGIVHRDLKPANVLIEDEAGTVKLGDFGIGGVAGRVAQVRKFGTVASALSLADQASLFRGAGTPLYADPDQKEGKAPDPRHDLYSLGVMWYQLLVGDVSREMRHGWEDELLDEFGVPQEQIARIRRCVGLLERRPANACHLLGILPTASPPEQAKQPRRPAKRLSPAAPSGKNPLRTSGAPSAPIAARAAPAPLEPAPLEPRTPTPAAPPTPMVPPAQGKTEAPPEEQPEPIPAPSPEVPSPDQTTTSPERLREMLLADLENVELRKRYLAVRTPELRQLDRGKIRWGRVTGSSAVSSIGGLLMACLILFLWSRFGWAPLDVPWFFVPLFMGAGTAFAGFFGPLDEEMKRNEARAELGPLPLSVTYSQTRNLKSLRRKFLGVEEPSTTCAANESPSPSPMPAPLEPRAPTPVAAPAPTAPPAQEQTSETSPETPPAEKPNPIPAPSLEAPAADQTTTSPERLREMLLADLENVELRKRYLALRTQKLRYRDGAPPILAAGGAIGFWLSVLLAMITAFQVITAVCGPEEQWQWWHVGLALLLAFLVAGGVILGFIWLWCLVDSRWRDPIAAELGPLPPGTPRDLDAARRSLLGDDKPT